MAERIYCYECEQPIDDDCVVVSVGSDHVFFHELCHRLWLEEKEAERHRQQELWEFFG